jgi:hypothetical protein
VFSQANNRSFRENSEFQEMRQSMSDQNDGANVTGYSSNFKYSIKKSGNFENQENAGTGMNLNKSVSGRSVND